LRQAEVDNEELRTLLQFQRTNPQWQYVGASVVSFDGQRLAQTVVIDRGSKQGVEEGLIVVVAGGLVGKVESVGSEASQVLLLTDPRSAVNAQVQGSNATGIVRASGDGSLVLDFVERGATPKEGDLVVTSGLGGSYPAGLLIGQVTEVSQEEASHIFLQVRLRPAVDFDRLRHLLIIRDFTPLAFP
jgi:rod shape-determining protein MreC